MLDAWTKRIERGAAVHIADSCAVEGEGESLLGGGVQGVESHGQVPAQAVTGDAENLACAQVSARCCQLLVPGLHVADLTLGKTCFFDFHGVGGLVVAG